MEAADRRPIATRNARWAKAIAARLARTRVTPNAISVASALFAALGGAALIASKQTTSWSACALYLGAALCMQARLLCNLFDGMVAIEGGKQSASGAIFNELPDRVSDTLFLLGAGYGVADPWAAPLGWAAALGAMATAYVRLLGVSAGLAHDFAGPMAKQQRMAVLTLACLGAAAMRVYATQALVLALAIIALGSWLTAARRTLRIVRQLEQGA